MATKKATPIIVTPPRKPVQGSGPTRGNKRKAPKQRK